MPQWNEIEGSHVVIDARGENVTNKICKCAEFSSKCPVHVGPYRCDGQAFSCYGDAQRHAWGLLRARKVEKATIGIVRTDGSVGTMEHWIIGTTGKFKWIDAGDEVRVTANADLTGRIVLS